MHQRISPRASRYDYSSSGSYFITICTKNREHYFGYIDDGIIYLSQIGKICTQEIEQTSKIRPWVHIDEYVVMPNHVHILIIINKPKRVGTCGNTSSELFRVDALPCVPTTDELNGPLLFIPTTDELDSSLPSISTITNQSISNINNSSIETVGSIIRQIKSRVKKQANLHAIQFERQGRYHDHIIENGL